MTVGFPSVFVPMVSVEKTTALILTNVPISKTTSVIPTLCVLTLKDPMSVDAREVTRVMEEIVQLSHLSVPRRAVQMLYARMAYVYVILVTKVTDTTAQILTSVKILRQTSVTPTLSAPTSMPSIYAVV